MQSNKMESQKTLKASHSPSVQKSTIRSGMRYWTPEEVEQHRQAANQMQEEARKLHAKKD